MSEWDKNNLLGKSNSDFLFEFKNKKFYYDTTTKSFGDTIETLILEHFPMFNKIKSNVGDFEYGGNIIEVKATRAYLDYKTKKLPKWCLAGTEDCKLKRNTLNQIRLDSNVSIYIVVMVFRDTIKMCVFNKNQFYKYGLILNAQHKGVSNTSICNHQRGVLLSSSHNIEDKEEILKNIISITRKENDE